MTTPDDDLKKNIWRIIIDNDDHKTKRVPGRIIGNDNFNNAEIYKISNVYYTLIFCIHNFKIE